MGKVPSTPVLHTHESQGRQRQMLEHYISDAKLYATLFDGRPFIRLCVCVCVCVISGRGKMVERQREGLKDSG